MANHYLETLTTTAILNARQHYYGKPGPVPKGTPPDALTDDETDFIARRDSFYMASVTENGWPYVQHRGGPPGFLHVKDPRTLAFADFHGNRQLISIGNFSTSNRVSLFLMDYPQRARLKILGHARVIDARDQPDLADTLSDPSLRKLVERIIVIEVVSYDWNCSQHITPRYTQSEVEAVNATLLERIRHLETELKSLRDKASPP